MFEIPGYRIERELGRGGMATVYLATQLSLSRHVALKVLAPALANDPVATERFLREAQIAAKLHHPHIVEIHDVGVVDGNPFMAMAYEPGGTVAQARIDTAGQALRIVRDIAAALEHAHRLGVVHRDVKPENILRRADGAFVLSDFGIARASESKLGLTGEGANVGTPHYMSPEQWRGEVADGRADLYGLGVVLYRLLTGELPFRGSDGYAVGLQHLHAPIPRLPGPLAHLQSLIDDLLAKDQRTRCQTGGEVIRRIDTFLSGQGESITPLQLAAPFVDQDSLTQPITHTPAKSRLPMFSTIAAVALIGLLAWQPWRQAQQSDSAPAKASIAAASASIAVLPLIDLSQEQDQASFSDGLSEELLDALARLPQLRVAGRTSAFSFREAQGDVRAIGQKLGVSNILQGSVRKSGERLRVTVQLLNCADGFHVWSETYDRQMEDVFALQDEIAQSVVTALKLKLLPEQQGIAANRHVPLAPAYTEYLRGRQLMGGNGPDAAHEAIAALQKATELDPEFASAFARLAAAKMSAAELAATEQEMADLLRDAMATAEQAIRINPSSADGYWARANLRMSVAWDWTGARADYDRALALEPAHGHALQGYGTLLASMGRLPDAIAMTRRVTELDQLLPSAWQALGYFQEAAGDIGSARESQRRALALKPSFAFAHFRLAVIALHTGDLTTAASEFEATGYEPLQWVGSALVEHAHGDAKASDQVLARLTERYAFNAAYQIAEVHAARGETDAAFTWLARAHTQRDGGLAEIKYDPLLTSIRNDSRYRELLAKLGLPP